MLCFEYRADLNIKYTTMKKILMVFALAFTSPLNTNKKTGVYVCRGCDTPLFKSKHKYDSGSGWPSFDREIKGHVDFSTDYNLGYARTEEHCATCGGHLGHVFNDGPKDTTGKRHCINGVSLKFVENASRRKYVKPMDEFFN